MKPVLQIVPRFSKCSSRTSSVLLTGSRFAVWGFIWQNKAVSACITERKKKEEKRFISTKYAAFKLFNKTSFVFP
jgi:hypothetical protein